MVLLFACCFAVKRAVFAKLSCELFRYCTEAGMSLVVCRMPQFQILLINTHVPRSTKQLVEGVRQKHSMVC